MLSKMLAGIANRRNLRNWPLRDFSLRQHVGSICTELKGYALTPFCGILFSFSMALHIECRLNKNSLLRRYFFNVFCGLGFDQLKRGANLWPYLPKYVLLLLSQTYRNIPRFAPLEILIEGYCFFVSNLCLLY